MGQQSALATQVGGDHYKTLAIQPMEFSMANSLNACQHTAIKYITRFRSKGGMQDLHKARHCVMLMGELGARSFSNLVVIPPEHYCQQNNLDELQSTAIRLITLAQDEADLPDIYAAIVALIEKGI